jgi:predicted enzyme related to lactoylglutathione lyase
LRLDHDDVHLSVEAPSVEPVSSDGGVAKGGMAVFIQVDDLDKTFESLRAAGTEILQEPVDQPYGVRDAGVRDPSGNHLRLSQPLAARG